ncbi:hypothetical protein [Saccharibacillus brassicae]|uniref:Uncharacterized protein n=1 Tax=Saccharibacillus brassicae TaxID=2583377 RepID=A0A4Y6V1L6_SACBS|nr:hypothetical protein [Saccharibacillus brassicae]QDH22650.1 hypothetical protein FFV09_18450 [Saccharibacillus brassicae]
MNDRDFKRSYAGVFADEGLWIDADGNEMEISAMDSKHKTYTIKQIFTSFSALESRRESNTKNIAFISGKYAKEVAYKLEELGCNVSQNADGFFIDKNVKLV